MFCHQTMYRCNEQSNMAARSLHDIHDNSLQCLTSKSTCKASCIDLKCKETRTNFKYKTAWGSKSKLSSPGDLSQKYFNENDSLWFIEKHFLFSVDSLRLTWYEYSEAAHAIRTLSVTTSQSITQCPHLTETINHLDNYRWSHIQIY